MKMTAIRWTISQAESEFGQARRTITKRCKAASIVPGADGKFSTADIFRALSGDLEGERIRKLREEADKLAIANAVARGELVDKQDFITHYETIIIQMRQLILNSKLDAADQDAILNELAKLHRL